MEITAANVKLMSQSATPIIVAGIVDSQKDIFDGGIDTPLRLCHFMAQCAHESAHFTVTREFASGAAYEGRKDLGNVNPGDGKRYRGRGLIQTTGRKNYRDTTADIKLMIPDAPDFEADPEALEEFPSALLSAISYWRRRKINAVADKDDVVAVTRKVNGGTNGLAQREAYLAKAKSIWMAGDGANVPAPGAPATDADPTLEVGDSGEAVTRLQNMLVEAGFTVSPDGSFGNFTKSAVIAFQSANSLEPDGVVGAQTWVALKAKTGVTPTS